MRAPKRKQGARKKLIEEDPEDEEEEEDAQDQVEPMDDEEGGAHKDPVLRNVKTEYPHDSFEDPHTFMPSPFKAPFGAAPSTSHEDAALWDMPSNIDESAPMTMDR